MLTVIVGFEGSGNSRARISFGSRYSVIPSTDVNRSTPDCAATYTGAKNQAEELIDGAHLKTRFSDRAPTFLIVIIIAEACRGSFRAVYRANELKLELDQGEESDLQS